MSSPSHWIFGGCDNTTPLGRITVHVSVCKAPATPDLAPDTVTASGGTTTEIERLNHYGLMMMQWLYDIPGATGPTTGLDRLCIATREMLWIPPSGRPVSVCMYMLSLLREMLKDTLRLPS